MKTTDLRTKPSLCPRCGVLLDAATPVRDENNVPEPGDISMCIGCGTVLFYQKDMSLREGTPEEMAMLPEEVKNLIIRMKITRAAVVPPDFVKSKTKGRA